MADINMNNQYAPQQPQFNAPAAPEKKSIPTNIIAIAAAVVAAIVLLIIIFGSGVPGNVKDELKDTFEGAKLGSFKKEYKISKDGATYYLVSGRIKDITAEEDDDEYFEGMEDYKGGYFLASAIECDDEVLVFDLDYYEKDDKDDFKDDLKEYIEDCKDDKDDIKDSLEEYAEAVKD